jgi:hypothetical protein
MEGLRTTRGGIGMIRRLIAAAVVLIVSSASAWALPPIYLYGEDDEARLGECYVNYEPVIAAAKAALRYNGVAILADVDSSQGPALYVNMMGGLAGGGCVVSVRLKLSFFAITEVPFEGKRVPLEQMLCNHATLLTGSAVGMQTRINAWVRDNVDVCLADYEAALSS